MPVGDHGGLGRVQRLEGAAANPGQPERTGEARRDLVERLLEPRRCLGARRPQGRRTVGTEQPQGAEQHVARAVERQVGVAAEAGGQ